jgi:hypothetical protein
MLTSMIDCRWSHTVPWVKDWKEAAVAYLKADTGIYMDSLRESIKHTSQESQ